VSGYFKNYKSKPSQNSGLSLVELMISMALSLVLLLGILQVFTATKKSSELISDLNELQDNANTALSLLVEGIRMADHWGGVTSQKVAFGKTALTAFPGKCASAWVFQSIDAVRGYDGAGDVDDIDGLPSGCIDHYLKGSDLLALRYADSHSVIPDVKVESAILTRLRFIVLEISAHRDTSTV